MPLHEYRCKKCGHTFEKIQKFSDPPEKKCPKCKGSLEQLLSSPAIQFKGTGWYVTDYAAKSGAPKEEGSKSETKPETTSETKSETKSEDKSAEKPKEKTKAKKEK